MTDPTRIADEFDGFRVCYRYLEPNRADKTLAETPFRIASRPYATREEAVATADEWMDDVIGLWPAIEMAVEMAVRVGRRGDIVWSRTHRTEDFEKQQQMKPGAP